MADSENPKETMEIGESEETLERGTSIISQQFYIHSNGCRFKIRKIVGDGNCLFRCMSYFIFGKQNEHEYIRSRIVQHVTRNWAQFRNFRVDEDMDTYQAKMNKQGTYGSEPELAAFAEVFQTQVIVYFKESPQQDPIAFGRVGTVCFLLYSGPSDHGHYDVLKPAETMWCDEEQYERAISRLRNRCRKDLQRDLRSFKEIHREEGSGSDKLRKPELLMLKQFARIDQPGYRF